MGNTTNDESTAYTYDAEGRPTKYQFVVGSSPWDGNWGNPASVNGKALVYDALGRMVENTTAGREYVYAPGGSQVFAVMNGQATVQAQYPLPAGGLAIYTGSTLTYAHPDWLGSGRLVSSSTQTMVADSAYAPFGEQYSASGSFYDFTGQQQWTATGLDDFLFRRYHPVQGRWISPDPAGLSAVDLTNPQTWNRYAYVANNPLSFVDPLGLECSWNDSSGQMVCDVWAPGPSRFYLDWLWCLFGNCDGGSGGGGDDGRSGGGGRGVPPPPPPPPKPPGAPPVTLTCQGSASFSDVSQSQLSYLLSQGGGALRPNIVPSTGTVAIGGTKTFGLSYSQLRQFGTYISINPSDLVGMISKLGGPAPPYSVSDIGDPNIRNASGTRFDIYTFPNATANTFGIQNSTATNYVIPAVTGAHCPSGSQLIQGPPQ